MLTPRSCSHLTLVSPRRNHSSSANTERVWTFLVVTSGNPTARSKRIWCPNTLRVPVPVRSSFVDAVVEDALEEVEVLLHPATLVLGPAPTALAAALTAVAKCF